MAIALFIFCLYLYSIIRKQKNDIYALNVYIDRLEKKLSENDIDTILKKLEGNFE